MRTITLTNGDGQTIVLNDRGYYGGYALTDADGLYKVDGNVTTTENGLTDGSAYLGTTQRARNIVLTFYDALNADHAVMRNEIYKKLRLKGRGVLTYSERALWYKKGRGWEDRQIGYYVESVDWTGTLAARQCTLSLICPDPFFTDTADRTASGNVSVSLENGTGVGNVGVEIRIACESSSSDPIVNPVITDEDTGEFMAFGTEDDPVTLSGGEILKITTHPENIHAYVIDGDTQTDVIGKLSLTSDFLRLHAGKNRLALTADSMPADADEDVSMQVVYRLKYAGV